MGKQITTITQEADDREKTLETSIMFEEGIKIVKEGVEIKTPAIKIWSSRKYCGKGPYLTLALVGTPCTPFHDGAFYTKETDTKEEMIGQHFNTINHFQKIYLAQKDE